MYSQEVKDNFIRLRGQGKSIRAIADELHVNRNTAHQWSKEFAEDIFLAQRAELETILEDVAAARNQRVRALARAFKKVEAYLHRSEAVRYDTKSYHLMMKLDKYLNLETLSDFIPDNPEKNPGLKKKETVTFITAVPRPHPFPENVRYQTEEEEQFVLSHNPHAYDDCPPPKTATVGNSAAATSAAAPNTPAAAAVASKPGPAANVAPQSAPHPAPDNAAQPFIPGIGSPNLNRRLD